MIMNNIPKITIIFPVYNQEKNILESIPSILSQTYKNFEVVIINDGSSDKSGYICDKYAQADGRIKVIHIPNGGISRARNLGLEHARGEIVTFVDSDDKIEPNFLQDIIDAQEKNPQSELFLTGEYLLLDKQGNKTSRRYKAKTSTVLDFITNDHIYERAFMWSKAFLLSVIKKNNMQFDITVKKCEDKFFVYEYLTHISKITQIDNLGYVYRTYTESSLSKTSQEYDVEYALLKRNEFWLKKLFNTDDIYNENVCNYICLYIYLALSSLYRMKTYKSRAYRLDAIRNIAKEFDEVIKKSTRWPGGNFLLKNGYFRIFDILAYSKTFIFQRVFKRYYS